uniref:Uncharacterized protein n=1 Tax=Anguilla anguilla TaxID=7936 RepID=A0A0E9WXM2_ANGAN
MNICTNRQCLLEDLVVLFDSCRELCTSKDILSFKSSCVYTVQYCQRPHASALHRELNIFIIMKPLVNTRTTHIAFFVQQLLEACLVLFLCAEQCMFLILKFVIIRFFFY